MSAPASAEAQTPAALRDAVKRDSQDRVVMFSAAWCAVCAQARHYFQSQNIEFVEYDVETNREARRRFNAYGKGGVPLLVVSGVTMRGFSKAAFDARFDLVPANPSAKK